MADDKKVIFSAEEAMQKANAELEQEEQEKLKDIKILSKDKKEKFLNGKATIIADYTCEENIAVQEEIILES